MIRNTVVSVLIIVLSATLAVAGAEPGETRVITPATIVMDRSSMPGEMERPAVEFDHAAHTRALEEQGCTACHTVDEEGLTPRFKGTTGEMDRDALIDAYHDACMSCHQRRAAASLKSGPVVCGECHVRRTPGTSPRVAMAFDYSLHARHAKAYPDKCETCHHIYDEAQQKLRYEKGAEESCRACHGATDVKDTPSLANASHRECVGCHLERLDSHQEGGPVLCEGCHDASKRQEIERLEEVPRLVRGQPDTLWVHTKGTTGRLVPFNHLAHEGVTSACSDCHHSRLQPCGTCHALTEAADGGGVILERAHHMPQSRLSCVGCHGGEAHSKECRGCHESIAASPSESACVTCHSGPEIADDEQEPPPPGDATAELAVLPAVSRDFPETVDIDVIADTYEAARLPHRKIAEHLDRAVRESRVAARFHDQPEQLCAGCHHHSPAGLRPPPCRSCHGSEAHPTLDKPGLYVAYHRQCIGCHRRMSIEKQGCEDCHAAKGDRS